jgi:periplasmic divalent cation tolerance protein
MRLIYVSCRPDEAPALAEKLVEERLVACASILSGVESVYRWEGRIEREPEAVLLMETSDVRVDAAVERLEALHSYDVPKIVVLQDTRATAAYARWVDAETRVDPDVD